MSVTDWNILLNAVIGVLVVGYGIWLKRVVDHQSKAKDATIESLDAAIKANEALVSKAKWLVMGLLMAAPAFAQEPALKHITLKITSIEPERGYVNEQYGSNPKPIPVEDQPIKNCFSEWRPAENLAKCTEGFVIRGENDTVALELKCESTWVFVKPDAGSKGTFLQDGDDPLTGKKHTCPARFHIGSRVTFDILDDGALSVLGWYDSFSGRSWEPTGDLTYNHYTVLSEKQKPKSTAKTKK